MSAKTPKKTTRKTVASTSKKSTSVKTTKVSRKKAGVSNKTTIEDKEKLTPQQQRAIDAASKLVSKEPPVKVVKSNSIIQTPEVFRLPRHGKLNVVHPDSFKGIKKDSDKEVIHGLLIFQSCDVPCLVGHVGKEGKDLDVGSTFRNSEIGGGYYEVVAASNKFTESELSEMLQISDAGKQLSFLVKSKFFIVKWPLWVYKVELKHEDCDTRCVCSICQDVDVWSRKYTYSYGGNYTPTEILAASDRISWPTIAPELGIKEDISLFDFVKSTGILNDTCHKCREEFWKSIEFDDIEQLFWSMEGVEYITTPTPNSSAKPVIAFGFHQNQQPAVNPSLKPLPKA